MTEIHQTPGFRTSIHALIGACAVITTRRVEIIGTLRTRHVVEGVFNSMTAASKDERVALVFDGWIMEENGDPLSVMEIAESLTESGID